MTQLSQEEKIDYIYSYIKTEKRNRIFKIILKVIILLVMIFGIQYLINNIGQEQIKKTISTQISELTTPIVKNLIKDLDSGNISGIDKEKIQKLLNQNPSY